MKFPEFKPDRKEWDKDDTGGVIAALWVVGIVLLFVLSFALLAFGLLGK